MKRLAMVVVLAVVAALTLVGCAAAKTKGSEEKISQVKEDQINKGQVTDTSSSMKRVLLNPKGFDVDFFCFAWIGNAHYLFLEEGDKITVNIDYGIRGGGQCKSVVTLTDAEIIYEGCINGSGKDVLVYYPEDAKTPFRGSGEHCFRIDLHAR